MSACPKPAVSAMRGRPPPPPAPVSCRTRREIKFTRMLGLPTFSRAFLQISLFKFVPPQFCFETEQVMYDGSFARVKDAKTKVLPNSLNRVHFNWSYALW